MVAPEERGIGLEDSGFDFDLMVGRGMTIRVEVWSRFALGAALLHC
jgi:hypothetical protein